jgi:16S rRNA (uracil1498-N3)-methyltransferase
LLRSGRPTPQQSQFEFRGIGFRFSDFVFSDLVKEIPVLFLSWPSIVTRMSKRFYVNCPLAPGPVRIEGPEVHHLAGVVRLRPGDPVCLFNGGGHEFPATVVACSRHFVDLEVLGMESPHREISFHLEIAAPLPKGDRGQFMLEKLTELGVAAYVPLRTARSVVHPGEIRIEKLRRIVIEASKQCGRNALMQVAPLTEWTEYCSCEGTPQIRILAHPGTTSDSNLTTIPANQDMVLAVGPEGGFTEGELGAAQEHHWRFVSLGPRILRIETAAVALAVWASLSGNLSDGVKGT